MSKEYLIGIDPSFESCGIAIYHPPTNTFQMKTGNFMEAMAFLNESGVLGQSIVLLENPDLDSNTFGMWALFKSALDRKVGIKQLQMTFGICMKRAQDIGKSKAAGAFMLTVLQAQDIPVIQIAPSKRDRADKIKPRTILQGLTMPTKTNAGQFKELTGCATRCSEHARDAAMLVSGKTIAWGQMQLKFAR